MNKQVPRVISIITIIGLLSLSGIAYAAPGLLQIGSTPLSWQMSNTNTQGGALGTASTFSGSIGMATNNPLQVWSPNNQNDYVIAVKPGSDFMQNAQVTANISIVHHLSGYIEAVDYLSVQENVYYMSLNSNSQHYNSWYLEYTSPMQKFMNQGTGIYTHYAKSVNFPVYNFNVNSSSAPYYVQDGIYKFSVTFNVHYSLNGGITWANDPMTCYAETYVVPGAGTVTPPSTVQVNHAVTISGTTDYGDYYLLITSPTGTQNQIPIGKTTGIDVPFHKSFTPTQLGKYTVTLVNSVVEFSTTQFFSASIVLPTPTIQVITPTSGSGYYAVGQSINYHITLAYTTKMPLQFNLYIYAGEYNQEPVASASSQWITENVYVPATFNGNYYSYNGTFVIPSSGEQTSAVTILGYATYTAANGSVYASNSFHQTISVGHKAPSSGGNSYGNLALALIIGVVSIVIAVMNPDTVPMKITIIVMGVVSSLIVYGVALL